MEKWKDIKGYEGRYTVSDLGRVKSFVVEKNSGRLLSAGKDQNGYMRVSLSNGKKSKTHKVHRLVLMAFIDNAENKPQVNHINGVKDDNKLSNLEWNTVSENMKHASDNNLVNCPAGWNKKIFSEEIIDKLGTMPDYKLAIIANTNKCTIARNRKKLGIESYAKQTGINGQYGNNGRIKKGGI